jgi:hypothetical protein
MKRFVVGTALWVAIVAAVAVVALHWPVVFWLLMLSACLYLVFGRGANIELRMGVGNGKRERRLYAAVVWRQSAKAKSEVTDPKLDGMKVEDRV